MNNSEILETINTSGGPTKAGMNAWILLAVSLFAFVGLGAFRWDPAFVAMLVVAIFVHELGHLFAMKVYRYKNLKMLFLPFIGGAASGEPRDQNAYKIAMISIFGPLIGFLSCYVAVIVWLFIREELLVRYAYLALLLNAFNLLPIVPLDGGHFLNETLFNRSPKAELVFKVLAMLGLAFLAYQLQSWILGGLAVVTLLTLGVSYKLARAARILRDEEGIKGGELTEEKVARIRAELVAANPYFNSARNSKGLPRAVGDMWMRVNKVFPTVPVTALLILLYVVVAVALPGFTWGVIHGATQQAMIQPAESRSP